MNDLYSPAIQNALASMRCRIMPTSFEADDPKLVGFPLEMNWHWTSCQRALQEFKPHGVMMRLPLFWQLEAPLYYACREVGAPIFLNDPVNMPVGASALARAGVDTVVTERRDAQSFAEYVREKGGPAARNWLIIHRASDVWSSIETPGDPLIAHEVQLFPGMTILYQCSGLMSQRHHRPRFHLAPKLIFDLVAGTVQTSADHGIASFTIPIPQIEPLEMCACGEVLYSQRV